MPSARHFVPPSARGDFFLGFFIQAFFFFLFCRFGVGGYKYLAGYLRTRALAPDGIVAGLGQNPIIATNVAGLGQVQDWDKIPFLQQNQS